MLLIPQTFKLFLLKTKRNTSKIGHKIEYFTKHVSHFTSTNAEKRLQP